MNPRTITLTGELQKRTAIAAVANLPVGGDELIEVVIRQHKKQRTQGINAAMWGGIIRDIAEQAFVGGRQYSADTWHEHAKREYLPEDDDPELDRLVTKPETWKKWDYLPNGDRVLVGSTTRMTQYGMHRYLEQLTAFGAGLGVLFSERRAA